MEREQIENWFKVLQDNICNEIQNADGKSIFQEDPWSRKEGGGGQSRIITNGNIIEKGGVNFSAVYGPTPAKILKAFGLDSSDFYATGLSIVMHPINPWVPIIHMNTRYFEMSNGTSWFGGGIDLTPHYINLPEARYFHQSIKKVCDEFDITYYQKFKDWADDYFFIKHRQETRGIGGIFFDRLSSDSTFDEINIFNFVKAVGNLFAPLYKKLIMSNANKPFSNDEKEWQAIRRSRYVEYNLIYDKGTKFGLDTDGRTESILMSMPPIAKWPYNFRTNEGSKEQTTVSYLKKNIDWINLSVDE